jgi:hypothetical protein
LGDDIVILNEKVAHRYLDIMSTIGVNISMQKSIVSKDSFEFAKRLYASHCDISPVSFKEIDVAMSSLDALGYVLTK